MADFFRRHKLGITAGILLLVACQLMSLSIENPALARGGGRAVNIILSPIGRIFHESYQSVAYLWDRYIYLVSVEEERNQLNERLKAIEAQNSRLIEFETQNRDLRRVLHFHERTGYRGVVASIIGRDPTNWNRNITIDRGSNDGLRTGLAVVDGYAVVGQTTIVTPDSAQVLLLTDHLSSIDAIVQNSRVTGSVEGSVDQSLNLRLTYVLKEYQLKPGERVVTSGLDGVFPKGLRIGVLTAVDQTAPGLFSLVQVEPSADIAKLEMVEVLLPERFQLPVVEHPEESITHSSQESLGSGSSSSKTGGAQSSSPANQERKPHA